MGRGIALGLGEAGWTVWVTARSSVVTGSRFYLPGSVEDTARAVTRAGGQGVAIRCDHSDDHQVAALAEHLESIAGRLDLLVNNAWGGYERLNGGDWEEWTAPFWEQPVQLWDSMQASGVRAHYVTTWAFAPLLIKSRGLVVTVSMKVAEASANVAYGVAKAADNQLALALDRQLSPHGVRSLALHPGLVRTEGVLQFAEHLDLSASQAPEDVGRVVAALAGDPGRERWGGREVEVAGLAALYEIPITPPG